MNEGKGSESFPSLRRNLDPSPIMTLKTPPPARFLVQSTTGNQNRYSAYLSGECPLVVWRQFDEQGINTDDMAHRQVVSLLQRGSDWSWNESLSSERHNLTMSAWSLHAVTISCLITCFIQHNITSISVHSFNKLSVHSSHDLN